MTEVPLVEVTDNSDDEEEKQLPIKRRLGRPKGAKNRPKPTSESESDEDPHDEPLAAPRKRGRPAFRPFDLPMGHSLKSIGSRSLSPPMPTTPTNRSTQSKLPSLFTAASPSSQDQVPVVGTLSPVVKKQRPLTPTRFRNPKLTEELPAIMEETSSAGRASSVKTIRSIPQTPR